MSIIHQGRVAREKPVVWMGSSKRDLAVLPEDVQDVFGYALDLAQHGATHPRAILMRGHLRGVTEVRADEGGNTYRAMYTARFRGIIYVLHVFHKKAKSGHATPRADLACVERRYKAARIHHETYHCPDAATRRAVGEECR